MRRSDKEVKEFKDIVAIMKKCDVCRVALNNNGYPYILPLNSKPMPLRISCGMRESIHGSAMSQGAVRPMWSGSDRRRTRRGKAGRQERSMGRNSFHPEIQSLLSVVSYLNSVLAGWQVGK